MEHRKSQESLTDFFAWMDELNMQAVERGLWECPLPDAIAHSRNCWIVDFQNGLTPGQALDADAT